MRRQAKPVHPYVLRIPEELRQAWETEAEAMGVTLRHLIIEAVEMYIGSPQPSSRSR